MYNINFRGELKQNSAPEIYFNLIDSVANTDKTGVATITAYYSKNGGSAVSLSPTFGEISAANMPGVYKLTLTTAMTDTLGELCIYISATDAHNVKLAYQVVANIASEIKAVVDAIRAQTDIFTFTGANVNSAPQSELTVATVTQAAKDSIAEGIWATPSVRVPFRSQD